MRINERPVLFKDSAVLKGLTVFLLIALLLIPLAMIKNIIDERTSTNRETENELINEYGGQQVINGPILVIPYLINSIEKSRAYFLPEKLVINGVIEPQVRNRGIYEFLLYTGDLNITGNFKKPDLTSLNNSVDKILWEEAYIEIEISDMKGLREYPVLKINGTDKKMDIELKGSGIFKGGLEAPVDITNITENISFNTDISIQGGKSLRFFPSGDETSVLLKSSWDNPSFYGAWLPRQREIIDEEGFSADWNVMSFARNFKSVIREDDFRNINFHENYFGVKLMIPVDIYQMTERCVKYGILFIVLPFLTFFLFEIFSKVKVHPFHYMFVGITACLFFLLLIALSEHISFMFAFVSGVISVCSLITYYSCHFLKSIKRGVVIFPVMSIAYFFMYMMINSQEYALLMGTIGIFCIVAGVMITTRKVDWYSVGKDKQVADPFVDNDNMD